MIRISPARSRPTPTRPCLNPSAGHPHGGSPVRIFVGWVRPRPLPAGLRHSPHPWGSRKQRPGNHHRRQRAVTHHGGLPINRNGGLRGPTHTTTADGNTVLAQSPSPRISSGLQVHTFTRRSSNSRHRRSTCDLTHRQRRKSVGMIAAPMDRPAAARPARPVTKKPGDGKRPDGRHSQ